jgi:hypothetical protein
MTIVASAIIVEIGRAAPPIEVLRCGGAHLELTSVDDDQEASVT